MHERGDQVEAEKAVVHERAGESQEEATLLSDDGASGEAVQKEGHNSNRDSLGQAGPSESRFEL